MEEKILELIEKMYGEFSGKFDSIDKRFDSLENEVKKTNIIIEHDVMPKITALFDGYIQNTDKLDRIEKAVVRHEETIISKIK